MKATKLMKNSTSTKAKKVTLMFNVSLLLFAISAVLLTLAMYARIPHATHQDVYTAGSQIVNGQTKFNIADIHYSDGTTHFTAPKNMHYIIFTFNVENTSDKPINILPANDTYMKNETGQVSFLTPYGLDNPFRAGELLPHEKITGQLSYLVPKNEAQKLYIDAVWSGALIAIAIN